MQRNAPFRTILIDFLFFMTGSIIYAISVNCFTEPNNIAPGGITGAAILINALTPLPIGLTTIALNLPLFIWAMRATGLHSVAKSIVAVFMTSIVIDVTAPILPQYQGDTLLATIFAGVLAGAGLAMFFLRGGTTGGTDLAASLIARHIRHIPIGKLIMIIDLPIVLLSIPVFRSIESPMYALIIIFISTKVIDAILYGMDSGTGKLLFIISEKRAEVQEEILHALNRGVTIVPARGSYTGQERDMLMVAVRRPEAQKVYAMVQQLDPNAFIIAADANDITGEGFRGFQQ